MILYILNLIDLACTLYALSIGVQELNPFMQNVPFMIFYKVIIIGTLVWWLSRLRVNLSFCTIVYALVDAWHLVGIILIT